MTTALIQGEQIFRVPVSNFAISPSASGYTLNYSADGENFDAWDEATPADKNEIVTNAPCGLWYKLVGNTSDVKLQY